MPLSYVLCCSISFTAMAVLAREGVSSEALPEKDPLLGLHGLGRIQFLAGCQTEGLRSLLALGWLPQGPPHRAAYAIRASEGEDRRQSLR